MKISSGISEILFNPGIKGGSQSERVYLWPLYNAGKVEKIQGVMRRTDTNAIYSKPSPEDKEKILSLSKERIQDNYSSRGVAKKSLIQPGSLFDAIV